MIKKHKKINFKQYFLKFSPTSSENAIPKRGLFHNRKSSSFNLDVKICSLNEKNSFNTREMKSMNFTPDLNCHN